MDRKYVSKFALVNPPLSLTSPSTITFSLDSVSNNVSVGLCLRSVAVSKNYIFTSSSLDHGAYVMRWNGKIFSHQNESENEKQSGFTFDSGDVVKVVFDPLQKTVGYFDCKSERSVIQTIKQEHLNSDDICFAVALNGYLKPDEVSIEM